MPDSVTLTQIVVPFADHPALYERVQYGAVVVTGDDFHARSADGQTIRFD